MRHLGRGKLLNNSAHETSMPSRQSDLGLPEWGPEPVPRESQTLGSRDFFVLWSSLGVGLLVLVAGSLLVPALGMFEALVVSIVGSFIGSLMLASAGIVGSAKGVPTMVSLRPVLGVVGSYVPTVLNVLQLVGWTSFEIMIMAQAATSIAQPFQEPLTNVLWVVVFGLWCGLLALGGPLIVIRKWLKKVAIWLVYASTIWITYQVFTQQNMLERFFLAGDGSMSVLLALDLVIVMPISWWPLISDYNRFARSPTKSFGGTLLGYTVSNTWFYFLGAAVVLVAGSGDVNVISSILALLLGIPALVLILVDETDNAFADIYSSAVSLQNIFTKTRQWKFIAVVTATGMALAITVPLAQYEVFLLMIGGFFVPLLGVLLSDYLLVRRRRIEIEEFYSRAPKYRLDALLSWGLGIGVYFYLYNFYPYVGSSIPSFTVSTLSLLILSKLRGV